LRIGQNVLVLAALAAAAAHAGVIFDYSPGSGPALTAGTWGNQYDQQNFAELVTFSTGAKITGYDHYTGTADAGSATFRMKLLADNAGTPGALLQQVDLSPVSFALDGTYYSVFIDSEQDIYRYTFSFPGIVLAPGVSYWIGMTGLSQEVGQAALESSNDGSMAQFRGLIFLNMTNPEVVGDQSFRLSGDLGDFTGTPEPATFALFAGGLAAMALARARRKAR
jgi:hypothetical protein